MKKLATLLSVLALTAYGAAAQDAAEVSAAPDALPLWEMIVFCLVVVGVIALGIWKAGDSGESGTDERKRRAQPITSWPVVA